MDDTPRKFYQKGWFIYFTLLFFYPLGLFLLWKYSDYSKKRKTIFSCIFALIFMIVFSGSNKNQNTATTSTPKPATQTQAAKQETDPQKEKDAFSAWYTNLQSKLNKVDKDWETWEKTFTALGNGSIDRYQAYANIKALSTAMYNHHANLKDYSIPKDLSEDRQKTLKEAIDNLSMWAYYRHNACDSVNELIDNNNFKPSELDKIKAEIDSGDRLMFKGLAMTTQMQSELGLLEQPDQK